MARHRLPDAVARIRAGQEPEPIKTIDVTTNEEIGQVARAVDDLHRQAIHLASGEAQLRQTVNAMFVTLSRRSTSLVNQQLAQIERLEHDEEDPKRLESLFRLDHLASRMRRTADSLLILADAPNRAAGQFSLTAGEALQAATSAVQDYQRVQILSHLGTRIGDDAAPDVVHLLTELVDNALTYSPPTEPVRLAAKLGTDGVTITITDAGLGVPPAELEQLNRDLAHGAEATPDTARRMGLFVVSRLAERHGIHAQLSRNPGGGMTATVLLPPAILPELPQTAAPAAAAAAGAVASTTSVETVGSSRTVETSPDARPSASRATAPAPRRHRPRPPRRQPSGLPPARPGTPSAPRPPSPRLLRPRQRRPRLLRPRPPRRRLPTPRSRRTRPPRQPRPTRPTWVRPDRPPLESLLPRREPGANIPRTGADAFLPPETSGETGPLFGKRTTEPAASEAGTDGAAAGSGDASSTERKVASVVPITALASRQRAQAEQARVAEEAAPVEEPVAEEPAAEPADGHGRGARPGARPAVRPAARGGVRRGCRPSTAEDEQVEDEHAEDEQPSPRSSPPRTRPRTTPRTTRATSRSTPTTRWAWARARAGRTPRRRRRAVELPAEEPVARSRPSRPPRSRWTSPRRPRSRSRPRPSRPTWPRPGCRTTVRSPRVPAATHRSSSRCVRAGSPTRARASGTRPRSTAAGRSPSTWRWPRSPSPR